MDKVDLSKVVLELQRGGVVVYPTDTLYALGADVYNEQAVRRVFQIKKRPLDNPLPVAVSCFEDVEKVAFVNEDALCLMRRFLPGSLTLILRKKSVIPDVVTGGLDKVAVRIPDHGVALDLLSSFGPLTVTSANVHGLQMSYVVKDIKLQLAGEDVAFYLDMGKLDSLPSTIVDVTGKRPFVVREGAIAKAEIIGAV